MLSTPSGAPGLAALSIDLGQALCCVRSKVCRDLWNKLRVARLAECLDSREPLMFERYTRYCIPAEQGYAQDPGADLQCSSNVHLCSSFWAAAYATTPWGALRKHGLIVGYVQM
jgi:hypothetical protein